MSSDSTTITIFGRQLEIDILNNITQVDNDTVIIKPRFNTSGLTELKVIQHNTKITLSNYIT